MSMFPSFLLTALKLKVTDEIVGNFSRAVHGLQAHNKLQEACKVLQKLTALTPRFSKPAQRVTGREDDRKEGKVKSRKREPKAGCGGSCL
ncbi:LOW QUALITY PROTEIN: Polycystic kidney disease protein 1-like 3 [Plecturocebus cupreus]